MVSQEEKVAELWGSKGSGTEKFFFLQIRGVKEDFLGEDAG